MFNKFLKSSYFFILVFASFEAVFAWGSDHSAVIATFNVGEQQQLKIASFNLLADGAFENDLKDWAKAFGKTDFDDLKDSFGNIIKDRIKGERSLELKESLRKVAEKNPDLILVQECSNAAALCPKGYELVPNSWQKTHHNGCGLAVYKRDGRSDVLVEVDPDNKYLSTEPRDFNDAEAKFRIFNVTFRGNVFKLVNAHFAWGKDSRGLDMRQNREEIVTPYQSLFRKLEGYSAIIMGDFNLDPTHQRAGFRAFTSQINFKVATPRRPTAASFVGDDETLDHVMWLGFMGPPTLEVVGDHQDLGRGAFSLLNGELDGRPVPWDVMRMHTVVRAWVKSFHRFSPKICCMYQQRRCTNTTNCRFGSHEPITKDQTCSRPACTIHPFSRFIGELPLLETAAADRVDCGVDSGACAAADQRPSFAPGEHYGVGGGLSRPADQVSDGHGPRPAGAAAYQSSGSGFAPGLPRGYQEGRSFTCILCYADTHWTEHHLCIVCKLEGCHTAEDCPANQPQRAHAAADPAGYQSPVPSQRGLAMAPGRRSPSRPRGGAMASCSR